MSIGETATTAAITAAVTIAISSISASTPGFRRWLFGYKNDNNEFVYPTPAANIVVALFSALFGTCIPIIIVALLLKSYVNGDGLDGDTFPSEQYHFFYSAIDFPNAKKVADGEMFTNVKKYGFCAVAEIKVADMDLAKKINDEPIPSGSCGVISTDGLWRIKISGNFMCRIRCIKK